MDEKDNHVVGTFTWFALAVLVLSFIIYGWFAPRAYGETISLEQALATRELPSCSLPNSVLHATTFDGSSRQIVELPVDIQKRVVRFLERHWFKDVAEEYRTAIAIAAFVQYQWRLEGYTEVDKIYYVPLNKTNEGRWCIVGLSVVSDQFTLPDEEVKNLLKSKQK